jgi:Winged helix DNA-binding domain
MEKSNILMQRLLNQHILGGQFEKPEDMVRWMTAVQAQDFLSSLWAIGIRVKNVFESDIEDAIANKTIVRTWLLRGTLHFVSSQDIRWILDLISPRIIASNANVLKKHLQLDSNVFEKSRDVIIQALEGGKHLIRKDLYDKLKSANISVSDLRGIHILHRLALEGIICYGPRDGKQHTFVLLDEWIPKSKIMSRENALGELALRYFNSHGPSTLQDFRWWSGLTDSDARKGLNKNKSKLLSEDINNQTYWFSNIKDTKDSYLVSQLLPDFDEYIVGYKDRSHLVNGISNNMDLNEFIFNPTIIVNGEIVGTWKHRFKAGTVKILLKPFKSLDNEKIRSIKEAATAYGNFINMRVSIETVNSF